MSVLDGKRWNRHLFRLGSIGELSWSQEQLIPDSEMAIKGGSSAGVIGTARAQWELRRRNTTRHD